MAKMASTVYEMEKRAGGQESHSEFSLIIDHGGLDWKNWKIDGFSSDICLYHQ